MGTACDSLLSELQKIWDEIGESNDERDNMLFELEQECLDAYRRKVDQARCRQAQLRESLDDCEAQLTSIYAALGDRQVHSKKSSGSLKKELQAIMPQLETMKKKRTERESQFMEVLKQINSIQEELAGSKENAMCTMLIDDRDLSLKRLDDLRNQLVLLQEQKNERQKQLLDKMNALNSLCKVLGMNFQSTISDIHPTLDDSKGTKSISVRTLESLSATIHKLKDLKLQRLQKLQDLAITMVELWNLMDTPLEEQQKFHKVTRTIAASENEIIECNILSLEFINNAEVEVMRLEEMKSHKMKEIFLKKRVILEEMCRESHLIVEGQFPAHFSIEALESGAIDPSHLLEQVELQISEINEEALSRKEILEKVQKWLVACEEECWLEDYSRDENRYNGGRGTHLMLKRAEKARTLVHKIPVIVEALRTKIEAWEMDRGVDFLYDGVRLMSIIEQYCELKLLKEQERQRQRDQKKIQGQLIAEKEAIFGSKNSPSKSGVKNSRPSTGDGGNHRFSGGSIFMDKEALSSRSVLKNHFGKQQVSRIQNHHRGFTAHSHGKKNITGKQQSSNSNSQLIQTSPMRKPLSPLCSLSSNITSINIQDQSAENSDFRGTDSFYKISFATPAKNVSYIDGNRTPKSKLIPMLGTPPTVSAAMQTAMTPFTPILDVEEIDYSYEEIRAGFIFPKSHAKKALVQDYQ